MDKRWSEELDEDLPYGILNHYFTLRDCIRMGAVCKSWLSASRWSTRSHPPQLPWLMMPSDPNSQLPWLMMPSDPNSTSADGTRSFFNLSDDTIYDAIKFPEIQGKRICGSFSNADARGWLMTTNDKNLEMELFQPWRKMRLPLPDHSTLPCRFPYFVKDPDQHPTLGIMKIRSAAMSDDAKVVVVIHDSNFLAFCRIGDKVWTLLTRETLYADVIYHKGQFYTAAVDGTVGLLHINTDTPFVEVVSEALAIYDDEQFYLRVYLVADSASESLFILVRLCLPLEDVLDDRPTNNDTHTTLGFQVYELQIDEIYTVIPVDVESLGDRLIFVGQNSSMLVMANQFPGFRGNRIYFTDDFMEACCYKSPLGCLDLGFFDMEHKTIQPLLFNRFHPTFSPPIWIVTPL